MKIKLLKEETTSCGVTIPAVFENGLRLFELFDLSKVDIEKPEHIDGLQLEKVNECVYRIKNDWFGCGVSGDLVNDFYPEAKKEESYLIECDNKIYGIIP